MITEKQLEQAANNPELMKKLLSTAITALLEIEETPEFAAILATFSLKHILHLLKEGVKN